MRPGNPLTELISTLRRSAANQAWSLSTPLLESLEGRQVSSSEVNRATLIGIATAAAVVYSGAGDGGSSSSGAGAGGD